MLTNDNVCDLILDKKSHIKRNGKYFSLTSYIVAKNLVQDFRTTKVIFAEGLKMLPPNPNPTELQLLPYTQTETRNEACQAHSH